MILLKLVFIVSMVFASFSVVCANVDETAKEWAALKALSESFYHTNLKGNKNSYFSYLNDLYFEFGLNSGPECEKINQTKTKIYLALVQLNGDNYFENIDLKELSFFVLMNYLYPPEIPKYKLQENNEYGLIESIALGYALYLKPGNPDEDLEDSWNARYWTLEFIKTVPVGWDDIATVRHIYKGHELYTTLQSFGSEVISLKHIALPETTRAIHEAIPTPSFLRPTREILYEGYAQQVISPNITPPPSYPRPKPLTQLPVQPSPSQRTEPPLLGQKRVRQEATQRNQASKRGSQGITFIQVDSLGKSVPRQRKKNPHEQVINF